MCARAEAGLWGRGRAWLRRPWAAARPGRASPSDTSAAGVEAPEGPQGLAAAAVGGGEARPG